MMKKPINKRLIYKPLKCEFWTYKGEKHILKILKAKTKP